MKYLKFFIILLLINSSLILPMDQVAQIIQDDLITTKTYTDKKIIKALFYLFHEYEHEYDSESEYEKEDQEGLKDIHCVVIENLKENNCINIYFINKSQNFQYIQIPKTNFEALKKVLNTTYEFPIIFEESAKKSSKEVLPKQFSLAQLPSEELPSEELPSEELPSEDLPPEELPFENEHPIASIDLENFTPIDNIFSKSHLAADQNSFKQKLNHKIEKTKTSKLLLCGICNNYYMEKLYNDKLEHYKYCEILSGLYTSNLIETYKLKFLLRRFAQRDQRERY